MKPLTIYQGEAFKRVMRWYADPVRYLPVTGVPSLAPVRLTVAAHGLVTGWNLDRIVGLGGLKDLNTHRLQGGEWVPTALGDVAARHPQLLKVKVIDPNTLELNALNATGFGAYTSGGVLECRTAVDLSGYSAKFELHVNANAPAAFLTLDTAGGGIVLDNTAKTITLHADLATVNALPVGAAVASLQLSSGGGGDPVLLMRDQPVIIANSGITD